MVIILNVAEVVEGAEDRLGMFSAMMVIFIMMLLQTRIIIPAWYLIWLTLQSNMSVFDPACSFYLAWDSDYFQSLDLHDDNGTVATGYGLIHPRILYLQSRWSSRLLCWSFLLYIFDFRI